MLNINNIDIDDNDETKEKSMDIEENDETKEKSIDIEENDSRYCLSEKYFINCYVCLLFLFSPGFLLLIISDLTKYHHIYAPYSNFTLNGNYNIIPINQDCDTCNQWLITCYGIFNGTTQCSYNLNKYKNQITAVNDAKTYCYENALYEGYYYNYYCSLDDPDLDNYYFNKQKMNYTIYYSGLIIIGGSFGLCLIGSILYVCIKKCQFYSFNMYDKIKNIV